MSHRVRAGRDGFLSRGFTRTPAVVLAAPVALAGPAPLLQVDDRGAHPTTGEKQFYHFRLNGWSTIPYLERVAQPYPRRASF